MTSLVDGRGFSVTRMMYAFMKSAVYLKQLARLHFCESLQEHSSARHVCVCVLPGVAVDL